LGTKTQHLKATYDLAGLSKKTNIPRLSMPLMIKCPRCTSKKELVFQIIKCMFNKMEKKSL